LEFLLIKKEQEKKEKVDGSKRNAKAIQEKSKEVRENLFDRICEY
jgi:hypothetical protein